MIAAMLSFHDEEEGDLYEVVENLKRAGGVELVVAAPGPYALFPYKHVEPREEELRALREATEYIGADLVVLPAGVYHGNEVHKRQVMLHSTLALTQESDWLFVLDSDHFLDFTYLLDLPSVLNDPEFTAEVGTLLLIENWDENYNPVPTPGYGIRSLMRARRGMKMGTNHYTYLFPDGTQSAITTNRPCTAEEHSFMDEMTIFHKNHRPDWRQALQHQYYEQRETRGIEA